LGGRGDELALLASPWVVGDLADPGLRAPAAERPLSINATLSAIQEDWRILILNIKKYLFAPLLSPRLSGDFNIREATGLIRSAGKRNQIFQRLIL
jgi:hypothetical protein